MKRRPLTQSCVVAAAAALIVTGCGGTESEPAQTTSSSPASATQSSAAADSGLPDPCTLLTDAEVTSLTGKAITSIDPDGTQPGESVRFCQWQLDGGQLVLTLQETTKEDFETESTIDGAQPVDGVGEQAYAFSGHLYVLQGAVGLDVYAYGGTDEENLAQAQAVASAVLPKLPA